MLSPGMGLGRNVEKWFSAWKSIEFAGFALQRVHSETEFRAVGCLLESIPRIKSSGRQKEEAYMGKCRSQVVM